MSDNQHQCAICHYSVFYHHCLTLIGVDPITYMMSLVPRVLAPQTMHTRSSISQIQIPVLRKRDLNEMADWERKYQRRLEWERSNMERISEFGHCRDTRGVSEE